MSDEARLILSAYRPGGQDAGDPAFAAALAAAKNDPALAQWFAEQQEFDALVVGHLRAVAVPADLRSKILAGAAASRPRQWWRQPRAWALAAAVLIFAGVVGLWPEKDAGLADWQRHGLAVLGEIVTARQPFDLQNRDAAMLTAWLRDHATPLPVALPTPLGGKPTLGCKTIAWDGHRMSLMCFDLGDGVVVHLFTTERAGLAHVPADGPARFARDGAWTVAMWNEGDKTLMLATDKGEQPLRRVLQLAAVHTARPGFAQMLAASHL
ncbi:MAG: hypothetical protein K8R23_03965 [Chthoniobacter sp.]|nr:hypothetical protein [Chthoniobacter sp.]